MLTWNKRVEAANNFLAELAARQHEFMNDLLRKANRPEHAQIVQSKRAPANR